MGDFIDIDDTMSLRLNSVRKEIKINKDRALDVIGTLVVNESKERVGVDTATLKNSIVFSADSGSNTVTIGSPVEYAPFHHAKNRFLYNAIIDNRDKILKIIDNIIE